jgi:hypothetical protein
MCPNANNSSLIRSQQSDRDHTQEKSDRDLDECCGHQAHDKTPPAVSRHSVEPGIAQE